MKGRSRSLKPAQHEGDGRRAGDPRFSPIQEAAFLTERQQKVLDLLTAGGSGDSEAREQRRAKQFCRLDFLRKTNGFPMGVIRNGFNPLLPHIKFWQGVRSRV